MSGILEKYTEEVRLQGKNAHHDPGNQIISSLTHELRTPLAVFTSNLELLKEFSYNMDKQAVQEAFHLCEEAVKSMSRFVEDVSLLNGFNKGEWKADCKEFDMIDFFNAIILKLPDHERNRVRLEGSFDASVFSTDDYLLSVVATRLLNNALKFSGEQVHLNVTCSKEELTVQVKDFGIGISQDEINQVFGPFYRGSNVKRISGSGLGLAIVKRSMELLKGEIELNSFINQGTTFNIKIQNNGCQKNFDY